MSFNTGRVLKKSIPFYATRKLDAEFLVPVLHDIDVSILTPLIFPFLQKLVHGCLFLVSLCVQYFCPFFISMAFKLVTTVELKFNICGSVHHHSSNKTTNVMQLGAMSLLFLGKHSTCFGCSLHPSSGVS